MRTPSVLLFVYGSLRRGAPGHGLLRGHVPLGEAVLEGYRLIWPDWYPAAVPAPGCRVEGELYLVPRRLLPVLDDYEDAPGVFLRRPVWVAARGGRLRAWAYLANWRGPVLAGCGRRGDAGGGEWWPGRGPA